MLYIPVRSFNFNSIFATESISPYAFYAKRQFGMKSFDSLDFNQFKNSILLFDKIVHIDHKPVNSNDFIFYIGVDENQLDKQFLKTDDHGAYKSYLYSNTIYFESKKTCFIFYNPEDKQTAINDSKRNLKTKLVEHYHDSFKLISESISSNAVSLQDLPDNDSVLCENCIEKDKKINKLKGFLYLFLYGWLKSYPIQLVKLEALTMDLYNGTKALLNDLVMNSSDNNFNNSVITKNISNLESKVEIIRSFLPEVEKLKESMITEHFLATNEKKMPSSLKNIYDWFKEFSSGKLPDSYEKASSSTGIFLNLDSFIDNISRLLKELKEEKSKSKLEPLSNEVEKIFKSFTDEINSLKDKIKAKQKYKLPEMHKFSDNGEILDIKVDCEFDKERYLIIANKLINDSSYNGLNIAEKKADLLNSMASLLKEEYGEEYISKEDKKYLNSLYKLLKRKPSNFNIQNTSDVFLKSLATFLLNPEDLTKLEFLINNNKIKDKSIALGLWGAIYGFSAIPRTIFEIIQNLLKPGEINILNKLAIEKLQITTIKTYKTTISDREKSKVKDKDEQFIVKDKKDGQKEEEKRSIQKEDKPDKTDNINPKTPKENLVELFKENNKPRTVKEIKEILPGQLNENTLRKMLKSPPFIEVGKKRNTKTYKLGDSESKSLNYNQTGKQLRLNDNNNE